MELQPSRLGEGVRPASVDRATTAATSQPGTPTRNTATAGNAPAPRRLWRNRDFMLLWVGQSVSALGTSMAGIVYPLLALMATGSVVVAGIVGFAGMATATILRLPSGVLVDRWPRKVIMVVADAGRAVVTAAIVVAVLADGVTTLVLVASAVVSAACGVMSHSAQTVVVRHVVPSSQLPRALAQNEARGHAASLAGQPLGGYLYAPANALLATAQIQITPPHLQGRVLSAVVMLAGIVAPLGPFVGALLLDEWGHTVTFLIFATLAGLLTVRMFLSPDIRKMRRPGPA